MNSYPIGALLSLPTYVTNNKGGVDFAVGIERCARRPPIFFRCLAAHRGHPNAR
jgi:hypothetical protein